MTKLFKTAFLFLVCSVGVASAQTNIDWKREPWHEPQDTAMALFKPDEYAWRLLVSLNWPAKSGDCVPDTLRKLGDSGEVVWERWAEQSKIYLEGAATPPMWTELCRLAPATKILVVSLQARLARGRFSVAFSPPDGDITSNADEEVRMNEASLKFIRDNRLFNLTVQQEMAGRGVKSIEFPPGSKEVKGHWIVLDDPRDHSRYHTGIGPDGKVYGLVAWHVITKDIPRWFWATFEHVDNENRWPQRHPRDFAGWTVRPKDTFACVGRPDDCNDHPKGLGLENTKWANYRLKATQIDWVDSLGVPTNVVNSKIEGRFIQKESSCISCHSLAMIGEKGEAMPFSIVNPAIKPDSLGRDANFVGVMGDAQRIPNPGTEKSWRFMQLDFVWSLMRARPGPRQ